MEEPEDWDKTRNHRRLRVRATNIQQMEYCSAIKRNKIGFLVDTWMYLLESVMQSEVRECIYAESRKMAQMNLCAGKEYNADAENGRVDMEREGSWDRVALTL